MDLSSIHSMSTPQFVAGRTNLRGKTQFTTAQTRPSTSSRGSSGGRASAGCCKSEKDRGCSMSRDYEIGYGKPPKKHQFKPGQSGNRKGRPKGTKNTATLLREILDRKIELRTGRTVTEDNSARGHPDPPHRTCSERRYEIGGLSVAGLRRRGNRFGASDQYDARGARDYRRVFGHLSEETGSK